jgi:hypothetical protein
MQTSRLEDLVRYPNTRFGPPMGYEYQPDLVK